MTTNMSDQRHELLEDMAAQTVALLMDLGVSKDVAEQCGCSLTDHFANHWGGQVISFPKDHYHRLSIRDMEIYNDWTGNNFGALARKYKMTVRGIYKIIARVRQRGFDQRQGRLDLPSPNAGSDDTTQETK